MHARHEHTHFRVQRPYLQFVTCKLQRSALFADSLHHQLLIVAQLFLRLVMCACVREGKGVHIYLSFCLSEMPPCVRVCARARAPSLSFCVKEFFKFGKTGTKAAGQSHRIQTACWKSIMHAAHACMSLVPIQGKVRFASRHSSQDRSHS